jgi:hypothetical protein
VILCCYLSCVCKNLDACNVLFMDMQGLLYLGPVLAFIIGWWWCWWCSWLRLISGSWYLLCSSQVACPAPPCDCLPSLPALHLLGAWPAPCCFWSCLSNHVDWLWLWFLIWWGEFPPDAQLMSRENLVSVLCCALVLVLWCWCCDAGRLGFLVHQFHTQSSFLYFPPEFWCLDTS